MTAAVDRSRPRRRALRIMIIVAVVLAGLLVGGRIWVSSTDTVRVAGVADCDQAERFGGSPDTTADVAAICTTLTGLTERWDAGDAEGYGRHFDRDATYIAFTGTVYQGRDDITDGHAALFEGLLADTRLATRFVSIRLSGDTATVVARGDTYEGGTPPASLSKVQTFTLIRTADGGWAITSFHNTQRDPLMERIQFLVSPDTIPVDERG